jgi:hypothetical protein
MRREAINLLFLMVFLLPVIAGVVSERASRYKLVKT